MPDPRNQFETKTDERKLRDWRATGIDKWVRDLPIWTCWLVSGVVTLGFVLLMLWARGC